MRTPKAKQKLCGRTIEQHCALKGLTMKQWLEKNDIDSLRKLYDVCEKMRLDVGEAGSLFKVKNVSHSTVEPVIEQVVVVECETQQIELEVKKRRKKKENDQVCLPNDSGETTHEQYE